MKMCLTVVMGDDSEGEEDADLFVNSKPGSGDKRRETRKEREERLRKMMEGKRITLE